MLNRDDVTDGWRSAMQNARALLRGELRLCQAYRGLFWADNALTPDGKIVLNDLMRFARVTHDTGVMAKTATGGVDPYLAGVIEGRRQVVSRIGRAIWLPDSELEQLKHGAYDDGTEPEY
jgi:hypothetical protein